MVPVTVRYERIMKLLDNAGEAIQKYKRELIGSTTVFVTPDVYSLLRLSSEIYQDPMKIINMINDPYQIRDAAKVIAQAQLSQMVELVARHDNLQAQKMEKLKQKSATSNKKKGGR